MMIMSQPKKLRIGDIGNNDIHNKITSEKLNELRYLF